MLPPVAEKEAEQPKQEGTTSSEEGRFEAAIDAYTAAITLCPNAPMYWTNMALCHAKLNDWERVESDCKKAIQHDDQFLKAHYVLGIALMRKKEYAEAVMELEKALDLGRGKTPREYKVEEGICRMLARAKYMKWKYDSAERSQELQDLKEACVAALKEKYSRDGSQSEAFVDENANSIQNQMDALNRVFNKAAENDAPSEAPRYLRCNIGLDILCDPVITPSGITYERAAILEHLEKVGEFDPTTTSQLLRPSQLVPNLAIEEAAQAFLGKYVGL